MNNGQSVASAVYQIKSLILKYREFIVYGIVGVLTTAVSWLAAFILKLFLNDQIAWQNVVINTLSWAAAIAFAYPANRKYVFESKREKELVYVNRTIYDGEIRPSTEELDGGRFWTMQEIREAMGQGILTPNFESEFKSAGFGYCHCRELCAE